MRRTLLLMWILLLSFSSSSIAGEEAGPPEAPPPEAAPAAEEKEAPVVPSLWSGSLEVGGNLSSGNTGSAQAVFRADTERKTDINKLMLKVQAAVAESETLGITSTTQQNVFGSAKYDHKINKTIYGYVNTDLLHDRFKDLNLRAILGAGVGHPLLDTKEHTLSVEVGVAYRHEDYRTAGTADEVTARVAVNWKWKPRDGLEIKEELVAYPGVDDAGTIFRNDISLSVQLHKSLFLKLGYVLDFDSNPTLTATGAAHEKADHRFTTTFVFKF